MVFLKKEGNIKLLIPLLVGLCILILLSMIGKEKDKDEQVAVPDITLTEMCSAIDGAGECKVMLTYKAENGKSSVTAAAVIYTGGGGVSTEREIKELISSLYGIGMNRIAVISSKKQI